MGSDKKEINMNEMNEYQRLASETSMETNIGGSPIIYPILGLTNEAGEVAGKLKKLFRDKGGIADAAFINDITGELGDCLWYISETCTRLGIDLSVVAEKNIQKLQDRKARGKIQGSGDIR